MNVPAPRYGALAGGWWLGTVLATWCFGFTVLAASDLWWHLAAGRWMSAHGTILLTDFWSFTAAGGRWHNESWLAQLIYQAWAARFGIEALVWWKWLVIAGTGTVIWLTTLRMTRCAMAASAAALVSTLVAAPFLDLRPQIYSNLGYALLISLTLGRRQAPAWLPLVFLVWTNLHGLFAAGLAALWMMLMPALAGGDAPARWRAFAIGLASTVACALHPLGLAVFSRPLQYAVDPASMFRAIAEWRPPFEPGGIEAPFLPTAIAVFSVALIAVARQARAPDEKRSVIAFLTFATITLVMALEARRLISLFAVSAGITIGMSLGPLTRRIAAPASAAMLAVVVALSAWRLSAYPLSTRAFHFIAAEDSYPIETLNFVAANQLVGKVFNHYTWGGYVDLRTGGALQVYIDGRADQVFSASTLQRYLAIAQQAPAWRRDLELTAADFVLWPRAHRSFIQPLLDSGNWRVLYEDAVSTLLARSDWREDFEPRTTPESAWRELALASNAVQEHRNADAELHLRKSLALMPWNRTACHALAALQEARGDGATASGTRRGCSAWFP